MGTCSEEEEVDGSLDEDEGNLISSHRKNVMICIFQWAWTINNLPYDYFSADVEINTMRYIDHESDNNGLVSENLIRLTPEEEDSGVFRYVLMRVR